MCSALFNDGIAKCRSLLPKPFTKHRGCLPDPPADEKQHPPLKCAEAFVSNRSFFLEYQAIFPLRWLVVGFGSFFQKQNIYLEFDGGEGKKTTRLWFSEKWNAQLLWKESDLNTLFILSKLPPWNRKHVFFLPFSEIWLMFIQFKLNLGKSVASAVFFFDVLLMLLLFSGPADWAAREGWTNTYLSGYRSSSVLLIEQKEIMMCLWSSSSPSCTVPAEIHLHPCTRFCPRQWNCQHGLLRHSV